MQLRQLRHLATGILLATAIGACSKDSTSSSSTTIKDPQATIGAMNAVDSVFTSKQIQSVITIASNLPSFAIAPSLGPIVAAALPRPVRSLTPWQMRQGVDARRLRTALPEYIRLGNSGVTAVIPDSLKGKTFEWNTDSLDYEVTTRTGAPAGGVRFILYAIDSTTSQPAIPLVESATLDVLDESDATTTKIHLIVKGISGTPTFFDYTFALAYTQTSSSISASGFVTDETGHRLDFDNTMSDTYDAQTQGGTFAWDFAYRLNDPQVSAEFSYTETYTATTYTDQYSFSFTQSNETLSLAATITGDNQGNYSGTYTIKVNGNLYATVESNQSGYTFKDRNGNAVTDPSSGEYQVLQRLGLFLSELDVYSLELLSPAEALLGYYF